MPQESRLQEMRCFPREIRSDVVALMHGDTGASRGWLKDISARGVYFTSDFELTRGSSVEMLVPSSKGSTSVLRHAGQVVRVDSDLEGGRFGVAVAFAN